MKFLAIMYLLFYLSHWWASYRRQSDLIVIYTLVFGLLGVTMSIVVLS